MRLYAAGRVRLRRGKSHDFGTPAVLALSLVVSIVGGVYSIGGGSIIAPFLVTVFGLPVYTVARATLIGTFRTGPRDRYVVRP